MTAWFRWGDALEPQALRRATGSLCWRGHALAFALDSLHGLDGRLDAAHLDAVPEALRSLMVQHVANQCLQLLAAGPLAELTLERLEWQRAAEPLRGDWSFSLRRPGAAAWSQGVLSCPDSRTRSLFFNWLAAQGWPLPSAMQGLNGRLQLGEVHLTPQELCELAEGDLVWLHGAELGPEGLRARFVGDGEGDDEGDDEDVDCTVWLRRSQMRRDPLPPVVLASPAAALSDGLLRLVVRSPRLQVKRAWLQGHAASQRLPGSVQALDWLACLDGVASFEAQLLVVGRRLGLRLTRCLARAAQASLPEAVS